MSYPKQVTLKFRNLEGMISSKISPDWKATGESQEIVRQSSEPVAVYDLRVHRGASFFTSFGKFSFVLFCCLSVYAMFTAWSKRLPSQAIGSASGIGEFFGGRGGSESFQPMVLETAQPQAPDVNYVKSWGITANSAAISWSTNVPSTTLLSYGTTLPPEQSVVGSGKLDVTHGVKLEGLKAATKYFFIAKSADKNGVMGSSKVSSFTTLPEPKGPAISNVVVQPGKNHKVQISWTTSVPAYSFVQIGTTPNYDRWSERTELTTNPHPAIVWVPSGLVHYQLVSVDAKGYKTSSPDYTFIEQ